MAGAGGCLGDHLAGDEDAFAGLPGDADDEVLAHVTNDYRTCGKIARV
jgi:hypothetical protein